MLQYIVYWEIFEDGHLVIIDKNGTKQIRKNKIFFTWKISQYTAAVEDCAGLNITK